jgi:hypothetical protein
MLSAFARSESIPFWRNVLVEKHKQMKTCQIGRFYRTIMLAMDLHIADDYLAISKDYALVAPLNAITIILFIQNNLMLNNGLS